MKLQLKNKRIQGFTIIILLMLIFLNPQKSSYAFLSNPISPDSKTDLKLNLIGEIIGYSYIKVMLEAADAGKKHQGTSKPFKGSCYEAVSSKTYRIVGSFDAETLIWKLDCFDKNNHTGVFVGKENTEGAIEGQWTHKNISRRFYLKRSD